MGKIGFDVCCGEMVWILEYVWNVFDDVGLFCVVCLSFMLGGSGLFIVYNCDEFDMFVCCGFDFFLVIEVFIEELIIGWKEFEMEVMCD